MSKIKWLEIVIRIFLYIFVIVSMTLLHELSHGFVCELCGGEFTEIGFNWSNITAYNINTCWNQNDLFTYRIVRLAGSFIMCMIAMILREVSFHKKWIGLYVTFSLCALWEFFYTSISPLIECGDAYRFLQTTEINTISWSAIFFMIGMYFFIKTMLGVKKLWELKKLKD